MSRLPRVAAVIVTLAAAALATTAQGDAHAASAPAAVESSATPPPHTRLILHVTGCDRCSIGVQHAVTGQPHVWSSSYQRIGSDHRAVFRVRTTRTHGLSFVFRAPWDGGIGSVPNVVTRYAGHRVGSFVSRAEARRAHRARGCWAGTTAHRVRLDLHVSRVPAKTVGGEPTHIPLVYATHSLPSWKPTVKTFKGTIGNQDAFYCTTPPAGRR